jgi:hypothetical protein
VASMTCQVRWTSADLGWYVGTSGPSSGYGGTVESDLGSGAARIWIHYVI